MQQDARMAEDALDMAAECARAVEASTEPTRRAVLENLQKLWIELSKKKQLLSERELLKETEDLYAMHRDLLGGQ
jgi:hypothetical protein